MSVTLYWMAVSHPSQAVRAMLELKGQAYETVDVLPLNQRVHLRLAGFRGGTVPALKLDGRRVQGSREIARALDQRWPEPPLFPADPGLRARVEAAEAWGERELQPVPRRLARWGAAQDPALRVWAIKEQSLPAPALIARLSGPVVRYYARTLEADGRRGSEATVRADLAALPEMLARVDGLIEDGTIVTEPPNVATLQILASVRLLSAFDDLHDFVAAHRCAAPAHALFPRYPGPIPPFLPSELLPAAPAAA